MAHRNLIVRDREQGPPFPYWIPATIVVIALLALALLPLIMNRTTNRLRDQTEETTQPARRLLNQVNYLLSVQISSLTRAAATGNDEYLDDFGEASAARKEAMTSLREEVRRTDPQVASRYTELDLHIARWERAVENSAAANGETAAVQESRYADVIQDLSNLDDALTEYENRLASEVRRLVLLETRISIGLVVLALIAAATVLWLQLRLRQVLRREREARRAAESLVRARDEILGIVSHDLRGPLTTISLSAQMLEKNDFVETIHTSARRMERLIEDLLDAAKAEVSTLSIRPAAMSPADVVEEVVASHVLIATEKGIELRAEVDRGLPEISGDRDRLIQALTNLVGNALKFTPAGGIVRAIAERGEGTVRLVVIDSGSGISEHDLPHLFEPFWQAKKTAHLGAGLGLKITKGIVEAHGGSIDVSNVAGGGARFAVEIPLTPPEQKPPGG